ncbi:TetR/AcrR family transcriptional regulator [Actinocrispum wychmicini]|uniref:TetR family transcriptional regulator n=1 Tax=Actinocrispum wychmicini TaxID=1213861 RepID=A0A4R2JQW5_9PSEU|nr:TetR/AcrR family transcriptional regulator [Actinocrispum wychmicini]TCO59588.1 TetR family transcriptional regulator [Actinocrispum wychmicini]
MERSGGGDPSATLRLLWRGAAVDTGRPTRGRPPKITLEQIVTAAVTVADRDQLEATTMDKVANELGVGTMSLYTHVPGKAELIDLMVDATWGELALPYGADPRPDGWRAQVELYARQAAALHERHPWLREISTVRPPLGPGLLARQEYLLSALSGTGLDPVQAAAATDAIVTFVDAAAGAQAEHAHAEQLSGQSDPDWWAARQAFWTEIFDVTRYPAIARAWADGGLSRNAAEASALAFDLGLRSLLDGIEVRVTSGS